MSAQLVIDRRHCGPARSGNGGWVAGALVEAAWPGTESVAQVRLAAPPPLEVPLTVTTYDEARATLHSGDRLIATAELTEATLTAAPFVEPDTAAQVTADYPGHRHHPFPTCFSCGTGRDDGLRIFPGPVTGTDIVAAPWTSAETDAATVWSALDCVGAWAGDLTERALVLGQMRAQILGPVRPGESLVVVGAPRGQDGRKTYTASSLYRANGDLLGVAEHVWISIDPIAFNVRPH